MKQTRLLLATIALLVGGMNHVYAQTADEIVLKHLNAIGGEDAWKKLKSVKMVGSINAGGQQLPITLTVLQGKGMKVEYTFNGMTGYSIITDKTGWNYSPFGGQTKPEVVPDEMVKQSQDELDMQGPMVDWKAKGNKITYLGKDDVEGTDCFKLKVTYPNGKEETVYIDAATYYHIKSVEKVKANGKEMEVTSAYGNFQKLADGLVFPMSLDNQGGQITLKTVEVNQPIPENYFQPAEEKK